MPKTDLSFTYVRYSTAKDILAAMLGRGEQNVNTLAMVRRAVNIADTLLEHLEVKKELTKKP